MAIDQLYYTWASRGVEGINRMQVVAMSEGLISGSTRLLLPMLKKVCRYNRPRDPDVPAPVSFGWFDYREHRIAFKRMPLPPRRGKVGNFAAHVLVAPCEELTPGMVAASSAAAVWWRGPSDEDPFMQSGPRQTFVLPTIAPQALRVDADFDADAAEAARPFLQALMTLGDRERLAVQGESELFTRCLAAIGSTLPDLLDDLSLSTFEPVPVVPFRVIAGAPRPTRSAMCSLRSGPQDPGVERTLDLLIGDGAASALVRQSLRRRPGHSADEWRRAAWTTAEAIVAWTTTRVSSATLPSALRSPAAIAGVITTPVGRSNVAAAAAAASGDIHDMLSRGLALAAEDDRRGLDDALRDHYAEATTLTGCSATAALAATRHAHDAVLASALRRALADPESAGSLDGRDVAALAAVASRQGLPPQDTGPLIEAGARHLDDVAAHRGVGTQYVIEMLSYALGGDADAPTVARALHARPGVLAQDALARQRLPALCSVLTRLAPDQLERALPTCVAPLATVEAGEPLRQLLDALPTTAAAQCLREGVDVDPSRRASTALDRLLDEWSARLLTDASRSAALGSEAALRLAYDLLRRSASEGAAAARDVLRGAASGSLRLRSAFTRARDIEDVTLRRAVRTVAAEQSLTMLTCANDAHEAWMALRAMEPDAKEATTLRRMLAVSTYRAEARPASILLYWIAVELTELSPALFGPMGRLRDRECARLVAGLAARLPDWRLEDLERRLQPASGRGRRFWRVMCGDRRRAAASARR